jgi:hypothetical protein
MELSLTATIVLVGFVIAAILYPIGMRALARSAQAERLQLAALGDELLSSPTLSEEGKDIIENMLDDAYNWRVMLLLTVRIPLSSWRIALRHHKNGHLTPAHAETRRKVDCFLMMFIRSVAVANPLAAVICAIEMAVLALLLFPMGRLYLAPRIAASATEDVDTRMRHAA